MGASDLCDFEGVRHACPVMVAHRRDIDLCLVFETAEGIAVEDPVSVSLEGSSQWIWCLVSVSRGIHGQKCSIADDLAFYFFTPFADLHKRPPCIKSGLPLWYMDTCLYFTIEMRKSLIIL